MVPMENNPKGVPVELVMQLKEQGLTNNQIIQQLENQGYEYYDIYDAITQSTLKPNVPINNSRGEDKMDDNQMNMPPQMPPRMRMSQQQNPIEARQMVEEIAESIIDEKWKMVIDSINKVLDWKDKMDERIVRIETNIERIQSDFDKLNESVIGKIGDYDKTMNDVGTELKSMEMVFKKALPGFVENVNELSRISESLKQIKKK